MEKYFCIFSELGTVRKDFEFKTTDEYFTFILANKTSIVWAKLIDLHSGETVDEYHNLNSIDLSTTRINIPDQMMDNVDSLLLINKQQLLWLTKFAQQETPIAYKLMDSIPIRAYNIPSKSSCYENEVMLGGLTMVDQSHFTKLINLVMDECTTSYKKRLFKMMVQTKGFEIIVRTNPMIESK